MPRVTSTPEAITRDGLAAAYVAADAQGHSFANSGAVFVHVKNGNAASVNVTITTAATIDGLAVADRVVAVPAGTERFIGPFPTSFYNNPDGTLHLDFSVQASVTFAVLKPGS